MDADLNQMAGTVDRNRVVLTLGNFSTLDVFDDNRYAKDPRVHFMNAAFMAPLSFDYAADARGYSWGITGEWYAGDWVLRAADRHSLSTVAWGGGCFLNALLSLGLRQNLEQHGLTVLAPRQLSPGDAGVALGQAWVAACSVAASRSASRDLALET